MRFIKFLAFNLGLISTTPLWALEDAEFPAEILENIGRFASLKTKVALASTCRNMDQALTRHIKPSRDAVYAFHKALPILEKGLARYSQPNYNKDEGRYPEVKLSETIHAAHALIKSLAELPASDIYLESADSFGRLQAYLTTISSIYLKPLESRWKPWASKVFNEPVENIEKAYQDYKNYLACSPQLLAALQDETTLLGSTNHLRDQTQLMRETASQHDPTYIDLPEDPMSSYKEREFREQAARSEGPNSSSLVLDLYAPRELDHNPLDLQEYVSRGLPQTLPSQGSNPHASSSSATPPKPTTWKAYGTLAAGHLAWRQASGWLATKWLAPKMVKHIDWLSTKVQGQELSPKTRVMVENALTTATSVIPPILAFAWFNPTAKDRLHGALMVSGLEAIYQISTHTWRHLQGRANKTAPVATA